MLAIPSPIKEDLLFFKRLSSFTWSPLVALIWFTLFLRWARVLRSALPGENPVRVIPMLARVAARFQGKLTWIKFRKYFESQFGMDALTAP